MRLIVGLSLLTLTLALDLFNVRLCWRNDVTGRGPSGITGVPALMYAVAGILLWPSDLADIPSGGIFAFLGAGIAFHMLFLIYVTRVVHVIRGTVRTDRILIVRCKMCHRSLEGLTEHRCSNCGREFDPGDSSTFDKLVVRR